MQYLIDIYLAGFAFFFRVMKIKRAKLLFNDVAVKLNTIKNENQF